MASISDSDFQVQEMQGLYGPFCLSEHVIQKIWLRQDFASSGLKTVSGKVLTVKNPGHWNRLNGPDFKNARLLLDRKPLSGDVEIHFNVSDWHAHQHTANPAFDQVILHVVLHEDYKSSPPATTNNGYEPEVLYLLPLLNRDLEDYAMDEALLALEQVEDLEWVSNFLEKPEIERRQIIEAQALKRWRQKVKFAAKRLKKTGWDEACHQYCLEVLGYMRNRLPMSRIALNYPLAKCAKGSVSVETLYEAEEGSWCLSGIRPANHPKQRLTQYVEMVLAHPEWPDMLASVIHSWPPGEASLSTTAFRRAVALPALRNDLRGRLFGGLGESRFNTLMIDAILPLATAAGVVLDGQLYWNHWQAGDSPDALRHFLKYTQITSRRQPLTNGLLQGALGLSLASHQ